MNQWTKNMLIEKAFSYEYSLTTADQFMFQGSKIELSDELKIVLDLASKIKQELKLNSKHAIILYRKSMEIKPNGSVNELYNLIVRLNNNWSFS